MWEAALIWMCTIKRTASDRKGKETMKNEQNRKETDEKTAEYTIPAELLDGVTETIKSAAEQILDEIIPLTVELAKAKERAATA